MSVPKVNKICEKCGKVYTRSKSRAFEHSLCRSCHMKKTYAENSKLKDEALIKRMKTCKEKYGVSNVSQNKEVQEKEKLTRLNKYGYSKPFENPEIQKKAQILAHTQKAEKKRINTSLENYGTTHPMKDSKMKKKVSDSYKKTSGYTNPMKNPDVKKRIVDIYGKIGAVKGYYYNNIHFDSSWELAYYIWLVDNKKEFIYHPSFSFTYIGDDSQEHEYYPDFLVEGKFYEIKGTQFFNENGEPYNMYTKNFWWSKYHLIKEHGVIILQKEDIKIYLEYIFNTYGKNYLQQYKIKKD